MTDADPRAEVDTLRQRLESGDRYVQFDRDRELLLKMSDHMFLVPSEVGDHRHLKLLRHNSRMASLAPFPKPADFEEGTGEQPYDEAVIEEKLQEKGLLGWALKDRGPAQAIVRWIHSEYNNEHTNQDYRTALRSFGRYVLQKDEPPESLDWIPTGTSNNFDPVPSERDLLLWERDVQPMIEDSGTNDRDAALMAVQFEGGLRGGDLFDLRVGDVFEAEHSTAVHVDGKEGERTVHLIVSIPYLQRWLSKHPAGNDPNAPLWSKLDKPELATYNTWLGYFKRAAKRVDVRKDVTPTNFRKSNTRWLVVATDLSQAEIEDRQGRKRGSEHTARYMARFGDESLERRYASAHGEDLDVEDENVELAPVDCPRCGEKTPRNHDFCMHCSQALDLEAQQLVDAVVERFEEAMVESDDPETRRELIDAERTVREKPNLMDRDELHQFVSSLPEVDGSVSD
ncbi:MAG: tyrosine-type recombinase/integrase [Halopenitus sp.]